MYFKALPEKVKDGIIFLNQDAIFCQRFREDAVLDELDEEELDLDLCNAHLRQVFRGEYEVEGVKVKPMTLAVWSWLWTISSPFVRMADVLTMADIDRFFYLLEHGAVEDIEREEEVVIDLGIDKSSWWKRLFKVRKTQVVKKKVWEGYCQKRGWTPEQACDIASAVIKDAFYPLKMMPSTGTVTVGKAEVLYDVSWLVSVVSAVHHTCGMLQDAILHKMPMMLALFYYVQAAKENGVKRHRKKDIRRSRESERQEKLRAHS